MRKLLLKLSAITLLATPVTTIVSCSGKSTGKITGSVEFGKSEYAVLQGETTSIDVDNITSLSSKGFTNCSVQSDDGTVADYINNTDESDNSTISIQGLAKGDATITVSFTNLSTQEIMQGSFTIHVLDYSDTTIDWVGADEKSPIDIYSSGHQIVFGKIKGFDKFKNTDIGYDYTSGFTATLELTGDAAKLSSFIKTTGNVDSSGNVCFEIIDDTGEATWTQNTNGADISVTVENKTIGIAGIKSKSEFVADYAGGTLVSSANTSADLNFNAKASVNSDSLKDGGDATPPTFKNNNDGTYTVVYNLKPGDTGTINDASYTDASSVEIGSEKVTLVSNALTGNNEYSVTVKLDDSSSFSGFSASIYLVFNQKSSSNLTADASAARRYTGTITQGFTDYLKTVDGVDGKSISDTTLVADQDISKQMEAAKAKFTPITITQSLNDQGSDIVKNGYNFSSSIVVSGADSDAILKKANPDPTDPTATSRISQDDIDAATDISKDGKKLAFNVNNVSVDNDTVNINCSGLVRGSETTKMVVLLIFKDATGNIIVGSVNVALEAIEANDIKYSSYIDTSQIGSEMPIVDKSNNSSLNVHDGLSIGTGIEMSLKDKTLKLNIGQIDKSNSSDKPDYSKWKVDVSAADDDTNSTQPQSILKNGKIDANGNVTFTQVGQGAKNVKNGKLKLTFTNTEKPSGEDDLTQVLYTSKFIGAESGIVNLSSKDYGDIASSTTVSTSLTKTSLTSKSQVVTGTIEYNTDKDTFSYNSSNAVIAMESAGSYKSITGNVIFDGNIDVKAPDLLNAGYAVNYSKRIVFNGTVKFQGQTTGTKASSYGCGILNTNVNHIDGSFSGGVTFNNNVDVTSLKGDKGDTTKFGLGVITSGATTNYGPIFFNGSVNVDSTHWDKGASATGLLVATTSYFSYYSISKNLSITAKDVEIDGSKSETKALVDDFSGYFKTTSDGASSNIKVDSLTLGKTDSSILEKNSAYGNAIYSRINGTNATKAATDACIGAITVGTYTDKDATKEDGSDASIIKFKSPYVGNIGIITVGDKTGKILDLLGGADYVNTTLKVVTLADMSAK